MQQHPVFGEGLLGRVKTLLPTIPLSETIICAANGLVISVLCFKNMILFYAAELSTSFPTVIAGSLL